MQSTLQMKPNLLINPYHLVEYSPWPLIGSCGALSLTSGMAYWFHTKNPWAMFLGLLIIGLTMMQWWRDVSREGTMQGFHTKKVVKGLKMGMILFITSEVMFFFAFFWAFFHSSLAPCIELGNTWPPMGINTLNPWGVPLLNTMILLSSGASITWSHHSILSDNLKQSINSLSITIFLGISFTLYQLLEYMETSFSITDGAYGSCFYVTTGFHGLHVIIGSTFLSICLLRMVKQHFTQTHHFGLEAAAWYWHFVDVVWLFLFITFYWWGSM